MTKGEAIRIVSGLLVTDVIGPTQLTAIKRLLQEVKRDGKA